MDYFGKIITPILIIGNIAIISVVTAKLYFDYTTDKNIIEDRLHRYHDKIGNCFVILDNNTVVGRIQSIATISCDKNGL